MVYLQIYQIYGFFSRMRVRARAFIIMRVEVVLHGQNYAREGKLIDMIDLIDIYHK